MSVTYPGVLVKLAEHHFIVLINHFTAKVTIIDFCFLCDSRDVNLGYAAVLHALELAEGGGATETIAA